MGREIDMSNFLKKDTISVLLKVVIVILVVVGICLFLFRNNGINSIKKVFPGEYNFVNEFVDTTKTVDFHCSSNKYETNIDGTFFFSKNGTGALVALFEIDKNDKNGISIELPDGFNVQTLDYDYRNEEGNPWLKAGEFDGSYVACGNTIYIANCKMQESDKSSGGGTGMLISNFLVDDEVVFSDNLVVKVTIDNSKEFKLWK